MPDLPHARAAIVGIGSGSMTAARLYRACLEGIALNLAAGVERLRGLGVPCTHLRAVGGGSRNTLWLELIADACNASVSALEESESAALGAALQAQACVTRSAGGAETADELAATWARPIGQSLLPDAGRRSALLRLGERFQVAVAALNPLPS